MRAGTDPSQRPTTKAAEPGRRRPTRAGQAHNPALPRRGRRAPAPHGQHSAMVQRLTGTMQVMQVLSNTAGLMVAQVMAHLSSFVAFYIVFLALPLHAFGLFTLALALREILSAIAAFGLDTVLIRMLAQDRRLAAHKQLLRDAIGIKVVTSLITGGLAVGALLWLQASTELLEGTTLVLADIVLVNVSASLLSYYGARLQSSSVTVAQALAKVVYLALLLGSLWVGVSWLVALFLLVISDAVLCLLLGMGLRRRLGPIARLRVSRTSEMLRASIPLGMAGIVLLIYGELDAILLAQMRGPEAVAYYGLAYKLTEVPLIPIAAIALSTLPLISGWSADMYRMDRVAPAACRALRYSYAIALVLAVAGTLFGVNLIGLIYGQQYIVVVPTLTVMLWAMVAMAANQISAAVIMGVGRQRLLLPVALLVLAVNVGLNLWAIPRWSYFGSAMAMLASEGVNLLLQTILVCWLLRRVWPVFGALVAVALGTASLAAFFWGDGRLVGQLTWQQDVGVLAGLLLLLALLRFVTRDDLRRLGRVMSRVRARRR
jgi:O-antigen/teichoic acid export membrane protein